MLIVSLETAVISVFHIPQAGDVGINFNDALSSHSKVSFTWRSILVLFVVWERELWDARMKKGGIIDGLMDLKRQDPSDLVWFQFRFNRCCSAFAELLNQNPINSTAAGSSCIIGTQFCRIRSASFGPIQKQIKAMWAQAHTAGPQDSGSRVNKCPACLSTAHGGTWTVEQWLIRH